MMLTILFFVTSNFKINAALKQVLLLNKHHIRCMKNFVLQHLFEEIWYTQGAAYKMMQFIKSNFKPIAKGTSFYPQ